MKKIQTLISRVVIGTTTLLLALSMVPAAHAQYSGTNGRIVFSSPSGYLTVKPDSTNLHALGTAVTGCYDRAIVYNPAGTGIAYTGIASGNTDGDIFLQNSTFTATAQQLTTDTASNDCDPYFSPDGTRIAFARQTIAGGRYEVWVMNSDGTGQTQLTDDINSNYSLNPVWLNANTIFVQNGGDIVSIDSTTAGQTTGTTIYDGSNVSVEVFDISPAGNQIVFDNTLGGVYTCVLTATCSTGTQIMAPGAAGITMPSGPAYSPDGTQLVFVGDIPGSPTTQGEGIYIANTDGTGIARMTFNSGGFQALAFTTYQPYWGTNNDTFATSGGGGTSTTPGVPNSAATKALNNSPLPWVLSGLLILMLLGVGGFWVRKELKGKK